MPDPKLDAIIDKAIADGLSDDEVTFLAEEYKRNRDGLGLPVLPQGVTPGKIPTPPNPLQEAYDQSRNQKGSYLWQTAKNVVPSIVDNAVEFVKGIPDMVNTVASVTQPGAMATEILRTGQAPAITRVPAAVFERYQQRYSTPEARAAVVRDDPAGMVGDMSAIVGGATGVVRGAPAAARSTVTAVKNVVTNPTVRRGTNVALDATPYVGKIRREWRAEAQRERGIAAQERANTMSAEREAARVVREAEKEATRAAAARAAEMKRIADEATLTDPNLIRDIGEEAATTADDVLAAIRQRDREIEAARSVGMGQSPAALQRHLDDAAASPIRAEPRVPDVSTTPAADPQLGANQVRYEPGAPRRATTEFTRENPNAGGTPVVSVDDVVAPQVEQIRAAEAASAADDIAALRRATQPEPLPRDAPDLDVQPVTAEDFARIQYEMQDAATRRAAAEAARARGQVPFMVAQKPPAAPVAAPPAAPPGTGTAFSPGAVPMPGSVSPSGFSASVPARPVAPVVPPRTGTAFTPGEVSMPGTASPSGFGMNVTARPPVPDAPPAAPAATPAPPATSPAATAAAAETPVAASPATTPAVVVTKKRQRGPSDMGAPRRAEREANLRTGHDNTVQNQVVRRNGQATDAEVTAAVEAHKAVRRDINAAAGGRVATPGADPDFVTVTMPNAEPFTVPTTPEGLAEALQRINAIRAKAGYNPR